MANRCIIPVEVLDEYHVYTGFIETDLIGTYQTFLSSTDYEIVKLYESIISDPTHMSDIISKFNEEKGELLKYRQLARTELKTLLDELYDEVNKIEASRM